MKIIIWGIPDSDSVINGKWNVRCPDATSSLPRFFLLFYVDTKDEKVKKTTSNRLKINQNVAFECFNFGIFCPIMIDHSGNIVWPNAKFPISGIFVHSNCKRISLRSQCWMRLFLWFSNTVVLVHIPKHWRIWDDALSYLVSDGELKCFALNSNLQFISICQSN